MDLPSNPRYSVQIVFTPPDRTDLQMHVIDTGSVTVQLTGELDMSNAPFVAAELTRCVAATVGDIRLDLSRLQFCDGAGVGVLVRIRDRLTRGGRTLVLTGVRGPVARILSVTGLDDSLRPISRTRPN